MAGLVGPGHDDAGEARFGGMRTWPALLPSEREG